MEQFLILLLFGWPAIIASLLVGAVGIYFQKPLVVLLGGIIALPHAYYLSGSPLFGRWAFLIALAYVGSAYFIWRRARWQAGLWLLPQCLLDIGLAIAVLTQTTSF